MIPKIDISDYDYPLLNERIAKYPMENRDQSKLLVFNNSGIKHSIFTALPGELPPKSLLVFNNTKVIRARMYFFKPTGARVEIFCLEPHEPTDAELAFQQTKRVQWNCMVGNLDKWKEGKLISMAWTSKGAIEVAATMVETLKESVIIQFEWNKALSFSEVMDALGKTPIPPYLGREAEDIDSTRYQTVYSKEKGSVAAPTAGLHFTENVLQDLQNKGFNKVEVTLHVGAGTFKPVKSKTIDGHEMHAENFQVSLETLKSLLAHEGPVIAVGTTSVRTLESLYLAGVKISKGLQWDEINQWDGFELSSEISFKQALQNLITRLESKHMVTFNASTTVIIIPGFKFKALDGIITNFHQPKSTLILLIAALVGEKWRDIYNYALDNEFRFLSYGDSSLLLKQT